MTHSPAGWPLVCSRLEGDEGAAHGDVARAERGYLRGSRLPERFAAAEANSLLEVGFGTADHFLIAAVTFLQTAPVGCQLDYFCIDPQPLDYRDLPDLAVRQRQSARLWLSQHPDFDDKTLGCFEQIQEELHQQWPDAVPGFHRRLLAGGRVRLTMIWGEPGEQLPEIEARFDTVFLTDPRFVLPSADGTAPLLAALAQRSAPGAMIAVAGNDLALRGSLEEAGFAMEGRGSTARGATARATRDRGAVFCGRYRGDASHREAGDALRSSAGPVAVVGAGMAGASMARLLATRGQAVEVFEAESHPAGGGSGNPAGLVAPVISRDWNRLSQLTATGMGFMRAQVNASEWPPEGFPVAAFNGVIKLARSEKFAQRQASMAAELLPDPGFARWLSADELKRISGLVDIDAPGWWFPTAGWLRPRAVIAQWLENPLITVRLAQSAGALRRRDDGRWEIVTTDGRCHGPFAQVVLAGGDKTAELAGDLAPWIEPCRGQVSWTGRTQEATALKPGIPIMREGYAVDLPGTGRLFGASFHPGDASRDIKDAEHEENRRRLASIAPSLDKDLPAPSRLQGRASVRATTPDRLPIVGGLAPGLWVSTGHGARGLTWSAWLAEYLASRMAGTPSPLPRYLAAGIEPQRFAQRAARRAMKGRRRGR
ncbi:FAD-dependent 5-carboxymethylaminomethyl-2-thiouridine(34) oxidoreductase MnmC [Guyparkeria sp. 1SP6A2]|nr:FAD-dependent 5-carboxymethylaminomethyl-2-thiouridine(34) oxidoreductase MnmC [Guyparkeria sp. 1SP6A2]